MLTVRLPISCTSYYYYYYYYYYLFEIRVESYNIAVTTGKHKCAVYTQILRDVGFATVESEDRTDQFVRCLTRELNFVEANKQDFVSVSCRIENLIVTNSTLCPRKK